MTTLIDFLSALARQPTMPLSDLDAAARAFGVALSDAEGDALRRRDAAALGGLAGDGAKRWCLLIPPEDAPEKAPEDEPTQDAPPSEPSPAEPTPH